MSYLCTDIRINPMHYSVLFIDSRARTVRLRAICFWTNDNNNNNHHFPGNSFSFFYYNFYFTESLNVLPGPMAIYCVFISNAKSVEVNRVFAHRVVTTRYNTPQECELIKMKQTEVKETHRKKIWSNGNVQARVRCAAALNICLFFFLVRNFGRLFYYPFPTAIVFYYKSSLLSALICRANAHFVFTHREEHFIRELAEERWLLLRSEIT